MAAPAPILFSALRLEISASAMEPLPCQIMLPFGVFAHTSSDVEKLRRGKPIALRAEGSHSR
jgi:hypothetical protein